jgi:hypothetical protein
MSPLQFALSRNSEKVIPLLIDYVIQLGLFSKIDKDEYC